MSFFRLKPDEKELFKVSLSPERYYSSSSSGITGSIYLNLSDISGSSQNLSFNSTFSDNTKEIDKYNEIINEIKSRLNDSNISNDNFSEEIERILTGSTETDINLRNLLTETVKKEIPIVRFSGWLPDSLISSQSVFIKNYCKDVLDSDYNTISDQYGFYYNNFHSLNFQSSSLSNNDHAVIYPCKSGRYNPSGSAFTFGFSLNIREKNSNINPGTIIFRSSSYAISVISGSSRDENGEVNKYKLLLQLGSGVDISPELVSPTTSNCFFSDDNCIDIGKWHEVYIRWGGKNINNGTGSFIINSKNCGNFSFENSPISDENSNVVVLGCRYEGTNSGNDELKRFFTTSASVYFGVEDIADQVVQGQLSPTNKTFLNHLSAEVHDIFIKNKFIETSEINSLNTSSSIGQDCLFYIKPQFIQDSNLFLHSGDLNDPSNIIIAKNTSAESFPIKPFINGVNPLPFNLSFGYNFSEYLCSVENFLKEEINNIFPRLCGISGSITGNETHIDNDAELVIRNSYDKRFYRRNLFILPCDHQFEFKLNTSSSYKNIFKEEKTDLVDESKIYLDNLIDGSNFRETPSQISNSFFNIIDNSENNIRFQDLNIKFGAFLKKVNETRFFEDFKNEANNPSFKEEFISDILNMPVEYFKNNHFDNSSPLTTIFKISPLYFGNSIKKGSITITDPNFYNSGLPMVLKDNGIGGIYRADAENPNTMNKVGNIYYGHGIILLISPALYYFGKDGFEMEFQGESNLHILRLNITAPSGQLNKSANKSKSDFSMISEINFLDKDFNTLVKAKLAQPLMKKINESTNIRIKLDF